MNNELAKERSKRWRKNHPEYGKNYYLTHKEHLQKVQKKWGERHKEEIRERARLWRLNNKERYNANTAKSAHKRTMEIRNEILQLLGNKCSICGFSDERALCIDHIHGGGNIERKKFSNYFMNLKYILKQLKTGSKDYQLLCYNHNRIKSIENKEATISKFAS